MLTPERYYQIIVEPTVQEFFRDNMDIRLGMLAAQCVMHLADHIFQNKASTAQDGDRQVKIWREKARVDCPELGVAVDFANAAKHCRATSGRGLESSSFAQRPPAFAGVMQCGITFFGDTIGGIWIHSNKDQHFNLTRVLVLSLRHYKSQFPDLPILTAGFPCVE